MDVATLLVMLTSQTALEIHDDHELRHLISRLVPWNLVRIQFARAPKANRWQQGEGMTHRVTVCRHNYASLSFDVVRMMDVPGTRQRFQKPVRVAIFIFGHPVIEKEQDTATFDERQRKVRISEET